MSFDRTKIYRIFTAATSVYYSNEVEYVVYAVEILRRKDYGDPDTTLLLKALDVSLNYRFMFLEDTSEFSPAMFKATKLSDMQLRASDLNDQLNLLLLAADHYQLGNAKNIIRILGVPSSNEMDDQFKQWDDVKKMLYDGIKDLLKVKNIDYTVKSNFIAKLTTFCEHTREMNENYTTAVLEELRTRLETDSARKKQEERKQEIVQLRAR